MDPLHIVALVFLIASWVLAVIALSNGSRPSPMDCAVWAIAVIVVFSGTSFG